MCGMESLAKDAALERRADIVVLGSTPGGIMAAVAAAREGCRVLLLERSDHVGGLPANGLGATDIGTRGGTAGLFLEFVQRVRAHYVETYGADSAQVRDCSDGYHFEPSVAEQVLEAMLAEVSSKVEVLRMHEFPATGGLLEMEGGTLRRLQVRNRRTGEAVMCAGRVFVDATYEGDLFAAAGAPFRMGREGREETGEEMAGCLYQGWREPMHPASTFAGDHRVQAYNYRLCLTERADNQRAFVRPESFVREEYVSLIEDVRTGRWAGKIGPELHLEGIGRLTNMVILPNGKTDANNQHLAFISTDLPEENQGWVTGSWAFRDAFAQRLRDYTEGLLWFAANDPEVPAAFREKCARWGFAADEYTDNGNFPRQVYVREGRRLEGRYVFSASDVLPLAATGRPPVHADSVTASHYALDSHAVRKREADRPHLEGFFNVSARPYTVPYRVMLPKGVDNLLVPVAVAGTHVGFSTLRMEPCWMALGQAAGTAAALALGAGYERVADVDIGALQDRLWTNGAVLIHGAPEAGNAEKRIAWEREQLRQAE